MKKLLAIICLSSITTFALFSFMAYLISQDTISPIEPIPVPIVEVYQLKEDSKPVAKERVKLTPPPPPQMPQMQVASVEPVETVVFDYHAPVLSIASGGGIKLEHKVSDKQARPIVRINPKYPLEAVTNGIEGYVVLSFNINEIGQVTNVNVVDAEPKRIFNKAAKRALKKWKYQAKVVDGKSIAQENLTVKLDFSMAQQS